MLIQKVLTRLQNLMQQAYGQDSDYADYDYLVKYVAIVNDDVEASITGLDLHFDTQVVVLTNVPANTTDLSTYQADGGALMCLVFPNTTDGSSPVEWRPTGLSDLDWMGVEQVGKVVDTNTATGNTGSVTSNAAGVVSWEWRGDTIFISPSSIAVDLRIRGDFIPNLADNDAAPFIKGLANILAYKTAALISALGPQNMQVAAQMEERFEDALFVFESRLSKSKHGQIIRLGGRRTQFPGMIGSFAPPIVGGVVGGGSQVTPNFADSEIPSGAVNGSNTSFVLAHTPNPPGSLILMADDFVLQASVGYTLSGTSLTLTTAPVRALVAWYRY